MKLIVSLTSPFARKVRIVLVEKNISYDLIVDVPWNADTNVPKFNPLGKVPVLLRDGGDTLFDSRVIVEFLEDYKPWPMLVPADTEGRIAVKKWEALADGVSDAAVAIFLERLRPPAQRNPEWIVRQYSKIENGLATMNTMISGRFCMGEMYTLADIAVGSCLGYLDLRFSDGAWRERFPELARLAAELAIRPSFQETAPPPA